MIYLDAWTSYVVYDRFVYSSHIYSHREVKYQPEVTDAIWDMHDIQFLKDLFPDCDYCNVDIDPIERKTAIKNFEDKGNLDKYEDVPDQPY